MCANVPSGGRSNDESTVRTVDTVLHVDRACRQHSRRVRMHHPMMVAALWDCSRQVLDSVSSTWCVGFGTRSSPKQTILIYNNITKNNFQMFAQYLSFG